MKNNGFAPVLILVFVIVGIVVIGAAFFAGTKSFTGFGKKTSAVTETSGRPFPTYIPTPTPDPTVSWGVYSNPTHSFSFKYPGTWTLDKSQETPTENAQIKLTKDKAQMVIILNLVGIGGSGRDFEGIKVTLDGHDFYEYKIPNPDNHTIMVGITDSLKQSLGVFRIGETTYSISLTYPDSYKGQNSEAQLLLEFNQMLATLKFSK